MTASFTAALAGLTLRATGRRVHPLMIDVPAVARCCARLARAHAVAWPTGVEYPAVMTVGLAPELWEAFSPVLESNTAALEAQVRWLLRLPRDAPSPRLRCVCADITVPFTVRLEPPGDGATCAVARPQRPAPDAGAQLRDEATGRVIAVPAAGLVLGRCIPGAGRLEDPTVSGRHARLEWHEATLRVVDLGSKNGTVVDGRRTPGQTLWYGDLLVLGRSALRVIHPAVDVAVTRRLPDRIALSPAGHLTVASATTPPEEVHVPTQPLTSVVARTTCLTVTVQTEATTTTVWLAGELDVTSASTMARTVHHLRQDLPHDVVLDVSGVWFCDARGLATILGFRSQLHAVGTRMTLRGCDPRMRLLLHLTGLDQLLA